MNKLLACGVASLALLFGACGGDEHDHDHEGGDSKNAAKTAAAMLQAVDGKGNEQYTLFWALVEQAGMADKLNGDAKITVFAPTDKALKRSSASAVVAAVSESAETAAAFVKNHVVDGAMKMADFKAGDLPTLGDMVLEVQKEDHGDGDNHFHISDVHINFPDREVSNGVVHGINAFFTK